VDKKSGGFAFKRLHFYLLKGSIKLCPWDKTESAEWSEASSNTTIELNVQPAVEA
jgi:hypothetical protein